MTDRGKLVIGALAGVFLGAASLAACGKAATPPPGDASAASPPASAPAQTATRAASEAPPSPPPDAATSHARSAADCKQVPATSEVELPPTDAGTMINASADAGADRTANDITRVIQRHRDRFRCCYDVAASGERGSFVLDFVLAPDGKLKSASHDKAHSDVKSDAVGACAIDVLRELSFPASKRGKESAVSYPFGFKPKASR